MPIKMIFIVDCKIYPFEIMVYFGEEKEPLIKKLKKFLPDKLFEDIKTMDIKNGRSIIFDSGQTLLWLKEKPTSIDGLALLNHEIFHCTCFILERVGIKYSHKSDEAFAYLIQYLTEEIYCKLNITFLK